MRPRPVAVLPPALLLALTLAASATAATAAAAAAAPATLDSFLPQYLLDSALDLIQAASAACDLLPLEVMLSGQSVMTDLDPLDVVEVTAAGRRTVPLAEAHRGLGGGGVVVYVPGWWNTPHDEAARALLGALLPHHRAPLVLDTRPAFARGYLSAAARVRPVATQLAAFVERLAEVGVPPEDVHLIGFSLGAHVAGLAGRLVAERTGSLLARITALDPAKPCFGRGAARRGARLARSDAAFVQALHSSPGVLGLMEPLGHTDVYVNGLGPQQPECAGAGGGVSFECDHNVSWRVYAASARRGGAGMSGRRCRSWRELDARACSGRRALLGYHCTNTSRGIYLYNTQYDNYSIN